MQPNTRRDLQLLAAFVLLTHLPFLTMPVQGDDPYYLYGAQHGLIDPLHPHQAKYIFQGREVWMLGHPHPPLNAWILTGLLASLNDVVEPVFHAAYVLLALVCAASMYALARKFTAQPLLASLLFLAAPVFWVSSNSFESDLPFLACLMAGMALFVHGHHWWAAIPLALSGLAAYQSVAIIPVLWLLRRGFVPACAPVLGVASYQIFERISSGVWPVLASAGYFSEYGLQRFQAKLLNAASLTSHLAWLAGPLAVFEPHWALLAALPAALIDWHPLFWCSFALGVLVLVGAEGFLGWWVRIFFAAALVLFFAGSARYLLPIAPAVCMLAANRISEERLSYAVVAQMMIAGVLALANYQHWQGYKDFVAAHASQIGSTIKKDRRVWVNGEWGLRFYAESLGALPMRQAQPLQSGELVLSSRFAPPPSGSLQLLASQEVRPALPFRLIGGKAGWSSVAFGVRPFDISTTSIDTITLQAVVERPPTVSFLAMNAPEAEYQLLSGFYGLEENRYRWMTKQGRVLLVSKSAPLTATVYVNKPCELTLSADREELLRQSLQPGLHTLTTPSFAPSGGTTLVTLEVDKTFTAPGDTRELGLIVQSVGFQ